MIWWLRIRLAKWRPAPGRMEMIRMGRIMVLVWAWQGGFVWAAYSTPTKGGIAVTNERHKTLKAAKQDAKNWLWSWLK